MNKPPWPKRIADNPHATDRVGDGGKPPRAPDRRRRRGRWLGLLVVVIILTHRGWLAALALPLQYSDPAPLLPHADVAVLMGGDGAMDEAVRWLKTGQVRQILLWQQRPGRLERYGVLPPQHDQERQSLLRRGAPETGILIVPCTDQGATLTTEERIHRWLASHPDARARVLCAQLSARWMHWRLLASAQQIHIIALPDRRFAADRWWMSRAGANTFLYGWFDLLFFALNGMEQAPTEGWDEKAYERALRQRLAPSATVEAR